MSNTNNYLHLEQHDISAAGYNRIVKAFQEYHMSDDYNRKLIDRAMKEAEQFKVQIDMNEFKERPLIPWYNTKLEDLDLQGAGLVEEQEDEYEDNSLVLLMAIVDKLVTKVDNLDGVCRKLLNDLTAPDLTQPMTDEEFEDIIAESDEEYDMLYAEHMKTMFGGK